MSEHSSINSDSYKKKRYAHEHVGPLLALPDVGIIREDGCVDHPPPRGQLQFVRDGSTLTAQALKDGTQYNLNNPLLVTDTPYSIGMKLPTKGRANDRFTVRNAAELIGFSQPVRVIDVTTQEELEGWTLADLVEYFEDEMRLLCVAREQKQFEQQQQPASGSIDTVDAAHMQPVRRSKRAGRPNMLRSRTESERVVNQISLEFSSTPMSSHVISPRFVRDLDWIDQAWSGTQWRSGKPPIYPTVQYYCLTSSAGCYTDFHADFGGSSVWYHVLSGRKVFCLISPTDTNLKAYEEWLCRKDQAVIFLPDMMQDKDDVFRITLEEGQTFIIPSGWIHSVYTPLDSVVFGGNFLHGLDMRMQIEINSIETRGRVNERFRFPFFIPTQFYAGGMYLRKLREGDICQREVDELPHLINALDAWANLFSTLEENKNDDPQLTVKEEKGPTALKAAREASAMNGYDNINAFLDALRNDHDRVLRDGIVPNIDWEKKKKSSLADGPRIRLKIDAFKQEQSTTSPSPRGIRIRLSQNATKATAPPSDVLSSSKRALSWKEEPDQLYMNEHNDEEWLPTEETTKPKRKSEKRNSMGSVSPGGLATKSRAVSATSKPISPRIAGVSPHPSKKQKVPSVRQRLLKKTGW